MLGQLCGYFSNYDITRTVMARVVKSEKIEYFFQLFAAYKMRMYAFGSLKS